VGGRQAKDEGRDDHPIEREDLPIPLLWYATEAAEAAKFYASIFPNSRVDRVASMQSESPSGPPGSVKVVDFTLLGQRFQAMTAGRHHDFNDAISMVVLCDDQAELDGYWSALLEGGGEEQACGWLIDKHGLRWQILPARLVDMMADKDPVRSKRVSDAMLRRDGRLLSAGSGVPRRAATRRRVRQRRRGPAGRTEPAHVGPVHLLAAVDRRVGLLGERARRPRPDHAAR